MGLDMYLEKKHKLENTMVELCYWRKANQIRRWFDEHLDGGVENCGRKKVEKEDLEELIDTCKKVLKDHSLASQLLPSQSGFFFGSTEYDEWYFFDVEDTIKKIRKAIRQVDLENEEVFYYEWW